MRVIGVDVILPYLNGQPQPEFSSGDRVHLLVSNRAVNEHNVIRTSTRTLLSCVEVFAVDDHPDSWEFRDRVPSEAEYGCAPLHVSLLVKPDLVDYIEWAERKEELYLLVRDPGPAVERILKPELLDPPESVRHLHSGDGLLTFP